MVILYGNIAREKASTPVLFVKAVFLLLGRDGALENLLAGGCASSNLQRIIVNLIEVYFFVVSKERTVCHS
jgi:hypothetical protein